MAEIVRDGDAVALEGFTHLIPFAAGHELLRQGRRELVAAVAAGPGPRLEAAIAAHAPLPPRPRARARTH